MHKPQLNPQFKLGCCYHINENCFTDQCKILVHSICDGFLFGHILLDGEVINGKIDQCDIASWYEIPTPNELKQ